MAGLLEKASNLSEDLEQVLSDLRIVAARAGVGELGLWLQHETGGYPKDAQVPVYRQLRGRLMGDIHSGLGGLLPQQDVTELLPAESALERTLHPCRDPIGSLISMLAEQGNNKPMHVSIIGPIARFMNAGMGTMKLSEGRVVANVTLQLSTLQIGNLIAAVRQKTIDFCLECESRGMALPDVRDEASGGAAFWTEEHKATLRAVWKGFKDALWLVQTVSGMD